MRTVVLSGFLFASLFSGIGSAQSPRDDWRNPGIALEARLNHSLADAPLTADERTQIYGVIDEGLIHSQFRDDQRQEERKAVLSASVGLIVLAEDRSEQIFVRSPLRFCGVAGGNCPIWVFVRQRGKLKLALAEEGNDLIARKSSHLGFRDLVTLFHVGFEEESFTVYHWSGAEYERIDCYLTKSDPDQPKNPPVIRDCPAVPR